MDRLSKADRRHIRNARREYADIISVYEAEKKARALMAVQTDDAMHANAVLKGVVGV